MGLSNNAATNGRSNGVLECCHNKYNARCFDRCRLILYGYYWSFFRFINLDDSGGDKSRPYWAD